MPHFTIEYSGNLDRHVDMGAVVELVRKAAVETGIFPLGGIRVRAIRCEHYAIADGRQNYRACCNLAPTHDTLLPTGLPTLRKKLGFLLTSGFQNTAPRGSGPSAGA